MTAESISWDDLVGAALLGTNRRPVDASALAGPVGHAAATLSETDTAARLLDLAAMITTYRRAGTRPASITSPTNPVRPETARPTPPPAASRLDEMLGRPGGAGLLTEWLQAAAHAGVVAPPALLPALLDLAVRRSEFVPSVIGVLGERGRWLAGHRADWHATVRPAIAASELLAPEAGSHVDPAEDPVWTHGTPAERRAWFRALRSRSPVAATELLAGLDWRKERGEDRLAFVTALRDGLSSADQPVLELAQGDRRQDVRAAAADLLVDLPDSSLAVALASIAAGCLKIERRRMRRVITVTLPDPTAIDLADIAPDPVPATARGSASGPAARLLYWLLARTRLQQWEESLNASPVELIALPVSDDFGTLVHAAWASAAARQRNATWADALAPAMPIERLADLLPAMPPARRAALVTQVIDNEVGQKASQRDHVIMGVLQTLDRPWPDEVAAALVRWLASRDPKSVSAQARSIVDLAGLSLKPERATAARTARAIGQHPDDSAWRRVIHALADTLLFRHQMLEELR